MARFTVYVESMICGFTLAIVFDGNLLLMDICNYIIEGTYMCLEDRNLPIERELDFLNKSS